MSPRPAPDLDLRRDQVRSAARDLAESEGWPAVTMRRLATELGVTQPVLYSVFPSRQALLDAVALAGFEEVAAALAAVAVEPMARLRAYLAFAAGNPRVYEVMFSIPTGLSFGVGDIPEPLLRAFAGIREVFPDADGTRAELAWSALHGLATLQAGGRLPASRAQARLNLLHRTLTGRDAPVGAGPGPSTHSRQPDHKEMS